MARRIVGHGHPDRPTDAEGNLTPGSRIVGAQNGNVYLDVLTGKGYCFAAHGWQPIGQLPPDDKLLAKARTRVDHEEFERYGATPPSREEIAAMRKLKDELGVEEKDATQFERDVQAFKGNGFRPLGAAVWAAVDTDRVLNAVGVPAVAPAELRSTKTLGDEYREYQAQTDTFTLAPRWQFRLQAAWGLTPEFGAAFKHNPIFGIGFGPGFRVWLKGRRRRPWRVVLGRRVGTSS